MNMLHVDSVLKSFGTNQVLTDVYLACEKGEIVGLLGRNGTGKSTLLKIIFGSVNADSKFIKIGNKIIHNLYDNRNLINYLPHDNFLPGHLRVKTIIGLFCHENKAELLKEHFLIKPLLDKKCRQLSGGELRLFEILLIVFATSYFTLIDEPFNGVAPIYKDEIKRVIKEHSEFKGFIITDHDYRNIMDIATRVVILYDGGTKEIKGMDDLKYWGYIP